MRGCGFRRESTEEAERYKDRCEALATLVLRATGKLKQARAEEERARAAAAASEAAGAAERRCMADQAAALTLMHGA